MSFLNLLASLLVSRPTVSKLMKLHPFFLMPYIIPQNSIVSLEYPIRIIHHLKRRSLFDRPVSNKQSMSYYQSVAGVLFYSLTHWHKKKNNIHLCYYCLGEIWIIQKVRSTHRSWFVPVFCSFRKKLWIFEFRATVLFVFFLNIEFGNVVDVILTSILIRAITTDFRLNIILLNPGMPCL